MIWSWDIDKNPALTENKAENPTNISGIQPLSDEADDAHQQDNSIVVTKKMGSHFEDFDSFDFEMAK